MRCQLTKSTKPQFNYFSDTQRFLPRENLLKSFSLLACVQFFTEIIYTSRSECVPSGTKESWEAKLNKKDFVNSSERRILKNKREKANWSGNIICKNLLSCECVWCFKFLIISWRPFVVNRFLLTLLQSNNTLIYYSTLQFPFCGTR